jgi:hypothetical protein
MLLTAASVLAAGADSPNRADSSVKIPDPLKEYYYGGLAPEKLAYCIDLWYDAALKGDKGKTTRCERAIQQLLRADLDSTRLSMSQFGRLLDENQKLEVGVDSNCIKTDRFSAALVEAQGVYARQWDLYKTKERLVLGIEAANAFSNKYRLMSDYIEVLRREVGLPKLKYAAGEMKAAAQGIRPPGSAN